MGQKRFAHKIGGLMPTLFILWMGFTGFSALLFGLLQRPTEMGLSIVAGALGMAFSSLDKVALFKGGSFELHTLRNKVEENAVT